MTCSTMLLASFGYGPALLIDKFLLIFDLVVLMQCNAHAQEIQFNRATRYLKLRSSQAVPLLPDDFG